MTIKTKKDKVVMEVTISFHCLRGSLIFLQNFVYENNKKNTHPIDQIMQLVEKRAVIMTLV